ncbi:MAG: 3-phosphoshikimate 1-carboxyvinyltransferase [Candidatus Geothermarchaeales archaeon]
MSRLKVFPSRVSGRIKAPPSKSVTHRAIVLASLANGQSVIRNPLESRDALASLNGCRRLGASITLDGEGWRVRGGLPCQTPRDVIDVENSGTTMRLLTATSTLMSGGYAVLTGDSSTRRRPMQPLLDSLGELGANCWSTRANGKPPVVVQGGTVKGGMTRIRGDISSQFISALLVAAPAFSRDTTIRVEGSIVSQPYHDMTLNVLERFGITTKRHNIQEYLIPSHQEYKPCTFVVPGDFSSAALLLAVAALTESELTVAGLDFSIGQGDSAILKILAEMGSQVETNTEEGWVTVHGDGLQGGEFDLSSNPDLLPVVAVLALKAEGETTIRGVKHARFKESDRIAVLATALPRFGVDLEEREDGLTIGGRRLLRGCELDAHGDHRIFMALCAAASGASEPCVVDGMESVDVSYPTFVEDLVRCGMRVGEIDR